MTNTAKTLALALTIAAGLAAVTAPAQAEDNYHWAYPMQYIGK